MLRCCREASSTHFNIVLLLWTIICILVCHVWWPTFLFLPGYNRELRSLGYGRGYEPRSRSFNWCSRNIFFVYQSIGPVVILRKLQRLLQTQDGLASDLYSIIVYYSRVCDTQYWWDCVLRKPHLNLRIFGRSKPIFGMLRQLWRVASWPMADGIITVNTFVYRVLPVFLERLWWRCTCIFFSSVCLDGKIFWASLIQFCRLY